MAEYTVNIKNGPCLKSDGSASLAELLAQAGLAPDMPCGGEGRCGKCAVTLWGLGHTGADGLRHYEGERALSCRVYPAGLLTVELKKRAPDEVLTGRAALPGGGRGLGLAVDIGTTTLAAYLYDLKSGVCLKSAGQANAQAGFGGDVISRIHRAAQPGGLEALAALIRSQISALARQLCPESEKIEYVALAGNTVMEHLFAGISPQSIGAAPYVPECTFGREYAAAEFLDGFAEGCGLYLCPAVSGFVGGDITAGLLSCGILDCADPVLYLDIGTNGEMALGSKTGLCCCSAAAGPAFEGGEIECGSGARAGAINRVDSELNPLVIGEVPPLSICGSGLISAAAAFLARGILSESGTLAGGRYEFGNGVYLSQRDIRQLQLGKAAIRAGIDSLIALYGTAYSGIDRVLIAGGFGAALDISAACAIGLLPEELWGKTAFVGNASGQGAALALYPQGRAALARIKALCRYTELSESDSFNEKYINSMAFGQPWDT